MKKYHEHPITKGVAKVPVIIQLEALECGAACLTMIAAYYGLWKPLEQVRKDCGVSRDGSNAKNILLAARRYGLQAKGFRYEPEFLMKNGTFPCIIHWNFNHFVVLKGFKNNKAYINDPAKGDIIISMEEFDKAFTGICLMFEPTEEFKPSGQPKGILSFVKERLKGTGSAFALVVLTTIIAGIISIINPAFSRIFIDRLLTKQNIEWYYPFLVVLSCLAIIEIIASWIKANNYFKMEGKFAMVADSKFMWHTLRLPMEFFSQRMAGDIANRQLENSGIASSLIKTLAPLFLDSVMMIFYLVVMIRYSVILTCIAVASIVINIFLSKYITKKRININRVQMRDKGKLNSSTISGIEMMETIKASGAENGYFERWSGIQASVNNGKIKYQKINIYFGMIPDLVVAISNVLILGIGVLLTMKGEFTIGMILAFQGFMALFNTPAKNIIEATQDIQEMRTKMERVEDVMKYPTDVDYDNDVPLNMESDFSKLTGKLELKHVTFGYSTLAEPLIKDFNLNLEPGKSVAFVGSSGCGKSTLSKLISGLYSPWEGEVLFDGKPINTINHQIFTGSLAVVDQDIILFEDTIANNIKMWDNTIEDFEMILAARDAQIHDTIMERDNGYQYKMLDGGLDFSGGQRQRLEIARVLAQDPTIVILDEATSALDAKTEYEVVKAIKNRGISIIVVAHRLSTIRDCDEIIVLDKGNIVERGTHDELIKNNGRYSELITSE